MVDQQRGQEELSRPMQRELDESITAAGGDIAHVRKGVVAALADINRQQGEAGAPNGLQADRALLMMELRYLDAKAHAGQAQKEASAGWLGGLRTSIKGWFGGGAAKNTDK